MYSLAEFHAEYERVSEGQYVESEEWDDLRPDSQQPGNFEKKVLLHCRTEYPIEFGLLNFEAFNSDSFLFEVIFVHFGKAAWERVLEVFEGICFLNVEHCYVSRIVAIANLNSEGLEIVWVLIDIELHFLIIIVIIASDFIVTQMLR